MTDRPDRDGAPVSDEEALTHAHAALRRATASHAPSGTPAPLARAGGGSLADEILRIRQATAAPAATSLRRLLFVWFRVYVREVRRGKVELTNVRIPIPIPLVGLLLPRRIDALRAARLLDAMHRPAGGGIEAELGSSMAFEFVRHVADDPERDKTELVVVGFD